MDDIRKVPELLRNNLGEDARNGFAGRGRRRPGNVLPFYMTYPLPVTWEEEDAARRDLEYLLQLYPDQAKRYWEKISRLLDALDYRGSLIYDEYPDRLALFRLAENVAAEIRREEAEEEAQLLHEKEDDGTDSSGNTAGTVSAEGWESRKELIQILLYYEIFRRRQGMNRQGKGWTPF